MDRSLQHLGEEHDGFVVHVSEPGFDLRDAAAADVEAGDLEFCGEGGLRPAERVALSAHLRADVVLVEHRRVLRFRR